MLVENGQGILLWDQVLRPFLCVSKQCAAELKEERGESGGRNVLQTVPRTLYTGTSQAARDTVQAYNSLIKQSS